MKGIKLEEEDRVLVWALFSYRDQCKKELDEIPDRIKHLKREIKNLTDGRIAEKFEISNASAGRQYRAYKRI